MILVVVYLLKLNLPDIDSMRCGDMLFFGSFGFFQSTPQSSFPHFLVNWQPRPLIMWNPRLISEDVGVGFNVRNLRRYFLRY